MSPTTGAFQEFSPSVILLCISPFLFFFEFLFPDSRMIYSTSALALQMPHIMSHDLWWLLKHREHIPTCTSSQTMHCLMTSNCQQDGAGSTMNITFSFISLAWLFHHSVAKGMTDSQKGRERSIWNFPLIKANPWSTGILKSQCGEQLIAYLTSNQEDTQHTDFWALLLLGLWSWHFEEGINIKELNIILGKNQQRRWEWSSLLLA